ncbi:MAG: ATP-binding protein [Planctomycetota bacterium]
MRGGQNASELVEFVRLLSSAPDEAAFASAATPLLASLLDDPGLRVDLGDTNGHDGPVSPILISGEAAGRVHAADEGNARTAARLVAEGLGRLRRENGLRQDVADSREELAHSRQRGETRERFLAAVSHEFRTPLTSIRSFAEILLDQGEEDEETRREFIGIIHEESVRLTRLVNNLLDLGRIRAGRMDWDFHEADLGSTIRTAIRSVASLAAEREVLIRLQGAEDLVPLACDTDKIIQVLVNLLSNAVKYSPRGEPIVVIAESMESGARITVRDRGPGIPAEYRKRIFDRFWRMEGGRQPGTGLGLAIALEIATAHGGRMWVDESPTGGCDFVFEIPDREAAGISVVEEAAVSGDRRVPARPGASGA